MIPKFIHGCISPVFTAFDEEGRLDDAGQRSILEYLYQTKSVTGYFVRSGMGQMFTFSYEDARHIAKTSCECLKGRGAVLAGCSGIWDRNRDKRPDPEVFATQAIELSKHALGVGAAAVVHTIPEAILPHDGETPSDVVLRYFERLNKEVNGPIVIYQSPGTDERYLVNPDMAVKLAGMPNIVGMKASTADAQYIFNITYAVRNKDFGYIVGHEAAFLAGLVTGAKAVIGQGTTLNPEILKAVQDSYEAGDMERAIEAQHSTNLLLWPKINSTEFFKRWISEKGFPVKPFARGGDTSGYKVITAQVTQDEYAGFKQIIEAEIAKFV